MEIGYDYLHNALDGVEHTTTVDAFYQRFHTIQSLLSFVHPEIPEFYFASRFVSGLQVDYQNFIFQFKPVTVVAAYRIASIFEESIYLEYFPELEEELNVIENSLGVHNGEEAETTFTMDYTMEDSKVALLAYEGEASDAGTLNVYQHQDVHVKETNQEGDFKGSSEKIDASMGSRLYSNCEDTNTVEQQLNQVVQCPSLNEVELAEKGGKDIPFLVIRIWRLLVYDYCEILQQNVKIKICPLAVLSSASLNVQHDCSLDMLFLAEGGSSHKRENISPIGNHPSIPFSEVSHMRFLVCSVQPRVVRDVRAVEEKVYQLLDLGNAHNNELPLFVFKKLKVHPPDMAVQVSVDRVSKIEYIHVHCKITYHIIYLKSGWPWIIPCLSTCLETDESLAGFSSDSGYGQSYFLWKPGPLPVRWQSAHIGRHFSNVGQNHGNMVYSSATFQTSTHTQSMVKRHFFQKENLQGGTSSTTSSVVLQAMAQKFSNKLPRISSNEFLAVLSHFLGLSDSFFHKVTGSAEVILGSSSWYYVQLLVITHNYDVSLSTINDPKVHTHDSYSPSVDFSLCSKVYVLWHNKRGLHQLNQSELLPVIQAVEASLYMVLCQQMGSSYLKLLVVVVGKNNWVSAIVPVLDNKEHMNFPFKMSSTWIHSCLSLVLATTKLSNEVASGRAVEILVQVALPSNINIEVLGLLLSLEITKLFMEISCAPQYYSLVVLLQRSSSCSSAYIHFRVTSRPLQVLKSHIPSILLVRVFDKLGIKLGLAVGYSICFEDCTSKKTVFTYRNAEMLFREFLGKPDFKSYSVLIIDEAWERTLSTDILLDLVKDIVRFRTAVKLIIYSTTLDFEKFSVHFVSLFFSFWAIQGCLSVPNALSLSDKFWWSKVFSKGTY